MKKLLALLLAVIAVVSLCSCSNNADGDYSYNEPSNQNQQLNAKTFTTLMDSNAFLYAIWNGNPCAFYFFEPSGLSFKIAHLNESFDIDYSDIPTDSYWDWNLNVYDDSHFSLSNNRIESKKYTYSLVHSDSKEKYVVFVDDEYKSEDDNNSEHMLIFMSHELLKSVWSKMTAADFDSLPKSVEEWVALIDSCK